VTRLGLVVAACALLVAACGGSGAPTTVPELEQAVSLARDRTDFVLERITEADSEKELLVRMDEAAETIEDAAGDVERVGVPDGFENEADELVAALSQLAVDLRATADQVRQPGFGDLFEGTRGLSFESWVEVNRALAALDRKGVSVAALERH
jgi:ABC-type glycerol-3-phosphate transport system substrate-binding protein